MTYKNSVTVVLIAKNDEQNVFLLLSKLDYYCRLCH